MRRDGYKLFSKGKIANLSIKNRLIRSATYEGGMTEDELKVIEAKYDPISPFAPWWRQEPRLDVLALIAEVRRLRDSPLTMDAIIHAIEGMDGHQFEKFQEGIDQINEALMGQFFAGEMRKFRVEA